VTTSLQADTDYADLVGQLSLAEKVTLLTGASVFTMAGNDKIGLAPVNLSDGMSSN
jgi:beta-glucosidase